ncbi:MAG TPA: DUF192 domain-containing protein [Candidatus Baltobacteraceae bacterium]|jgi:hypothetical protein|nr:DUF192 domain-containing protein [Candidatus Baltobacteraceae bacterium]
MIFSTLIFAGALAADSPSPLPTPQSLPAITVRAPKAVLHVQVARNEEQRERGLMSVTHLPAHTGMLFIFEGDSPVAFWMKDTLLPLDMIFIAQDGTVRKIYANVAVVPPAMPDADIPRESGTAKYVIELPANEAAADGIAPGIRLPSLPK